VPTGGFRESSRRLKILWVCAQVGLGKNLMDGFSKLGGLGRGLFGRNSPEKRVTHQEQSNPGQKSETGGVGGAGADSSEPGSALLTARSQRSQQTPRTSMLAQLTPRTRRIASRVSTHMLGRAHSRRSMVPSSAVSAGHSLQQEKLDEDLSVMADAIAEQLSTFVRRLASDCAQTSATLPLVQIQSGLRDLQVGSKVLEILRSLYQEGNLPESGPCLDLMRECCTLLAWFTMGNVRNAAIVAKDIELLLSYLEHPRGLDIGVDQVITALFYNNRLLCTQGAAKIEKRVISLLLQRGQKYPLLKLLCALLCPNGVGIKRNQSRVVRMLDLHKAKILRLFEESEGLLELRRHMRSLEHTAGPEDEANFGSVGERRRGRGSQGGEESPTGAGGSGADRSDEEKAGSKDALLVRAVINPYVNRDSVVLFHLYTLKLLSTACAGNNFSAERTAGEMAPISRCCELVAASWCIPETKIATLDLLLECHLLREDLSVASSRALAQEEGMWNLMSPPPPRTNRTRRVPHPVLIGPAASLTPY